MLKKDSSKIIPGEDYVITEIVHCQSNNEDGVYEARNICADKYLEQILGIATKAKVITLLGVHAIQAFNERYSLNLSDFGMETKELSGRKRLIFALPHPNSRGKRKKLNQQEIEKIHSSLH